MPSGLARYVRLNIDRVAVQMPAVERACCALCEKLALTRQCSQAFGDGEVGVAYEDGALHHCH